MLNKTLFFALAISCFTGLHANNDELRHPKRIPLNSPPSLMVCEEVKEEIQKDLTPGALVCNETEDRCTNEEGKTEETSSSALFSVFCDDSEEEVKLSCKDCH